MSEVKSWIASLAFVISTCTWGLSGLAWAQAEPATKSDASNVTALKTDVERLKQDVESIRSELRLILQRLAQPQPPQQPPRVVARIAVGDNPVLGKRDAPLTLIEFADYQCPYCRQFFDTTMGTLKQEYVEAGKLRYVFRDFPMAQLHPQARKAAEAARCAGEQGKYWEMHDVLLQNQQALHSEQLQVYAERLHLDGMAFRACFAAGKYRTLIQQNYDEAQSAGVRGTPSFLLGKTQPDDTIEGVLIRGARPLEEFRNEIERILAEK